MIIYAITNELNGKRYIGMTEMTLARRWYSHVHSARSGRNSPLYHAIRKYGEDAFVIESLAEMIPGMGRDDLMAMEMRLIAQEGTLCPAGYNASPGGKSLPKGYKHTSPSRLTGRTLSPEVRAKMSAAHMGHAVSEKTRTRIVELNKARTGIPLSEETRAKLRGKPGVPWSDEQRARRADYWNDERRAAQSVLMTEIRRARRISHG